MPPASPLLPARILRLVLRPIAGFCLRHAVKIQDLIEGLKVELIGAAKQDLARRGAKITPSRLSVLTGIRRREIARLEEIEAETAAPRNLVTRVIALWQQDAQFLTKEERPRVLSLHPQRNEFADLVHKASKELYPATVLFELERLGAVTRTPAGVKLNVQNYVPEGDALKGFQFVSQHLADLLDAGAQNIFTRPEIPHHQLYTEYDRVRPAQAAQLRAWFLREGHALHLRLRKRIGRYDQDVNPDPAFHGKGVRVAFGSFSFIDEDSQETPHE